MSDGLGNLFETCEICAGSLAEVHGRHSSFFSRGTSSSVLCLRAWDRRLSTLCRHVYRAHNWNDDQEP